MVVLAPTDVTASDGTYENRVEISWNSSSTTAVLYKVFRDGTFIKSVSVGGRTHTDYDGTAGQKYIYSVVAMTSLGEESEPGSDMGSRELRSPAPVEASDDEHEGEILITWADRSLTESGYVVVREDTLTGVVDTLGTKRANSTSFSDVTAVPGTTYMYEVAAYDSLGEALGYSEPAEDLGRRVLNPPYNVLATDGDFEDRVEITWDDNSMAEDGYYIYRNDALLDSVADNHTSYVDMNPLFGVTTEYGVRAFDAYGESDPGATGSRDTGFTSILAPGYLNASDTYTDRVDLVWVDVSQIESKYIIKRNGVVIDSTAANATYYTDNTASPGVAYEYCVMSKWCDSTCSLASYSAEACDQGIRLDPAGPSTSLWEPDGKLKGGSGSVDMGEGIAVGGDVIVVGDRFGTGAAVQSGLAFVFERDDAGNWSQTAKLRASDGAQHDNFGYSVGIDEGVIVVGASGYGNTGKIYVFNRNSDGTWPATETLSWRAGDTVAGDDLGWAVAIDEPVRIYGALGQNDARGSAYIWEGNKMVEVTASDRAVNDQFGSAVAVGDGVALVGAALDDNANGSNAGAAYLYERKTSGTFKWNLHETQKLVASDGAADDYFGLSVAVSGNAALVGAPNAGAAYIFERNAAGTWVETQKLTASDVSGPYSFGYRVSINEEVAIIGAHFDDDLGSNSGAAYIFARGVDGTWRELRKLRADDGDAGDEFGISVAVDGELAVSGASGDESGGSAYVFDLVHQPGDVAASDGAFSNRVRVEWEDRSSGEDGFNIYRDGEPIATVRADEVVYDDDEALASRAYDYWVEAFSGTRLGLGPVRDYGWRPPDGNITGRVYTASGAGVESIAVCLDPAPERAILLDGTGGRVRIADDGAFNFGASDDFTVELWFNYNGYGGIGAQNDVLIAKAEPGAGTYPFMLSNRRAEGSEEELSFKISDGTPATVNTGVVDGLADGWHHVACVHDVLELELRIYVDGVLKGTTPYTSLGAIGNADDLMLGLGAVAESFFEGRLDEVRIWDVVRTEDEIQTTMNQLLTGDEPGLVGYWPADGGSGDLLIDATEGARYGILEGGAYWSGDAAPLDVCATTDLEGNYSRTGICYGEETTFKVRPYMADKQFSPVFKMITLNPENPVENQVDFVDMTSYTVSGQIKFAGYDCAVPNVPIYVDGVALGATDKRGKFTVAITTSGEHWFRPRLDDHTFAPDSLRLDLNDDMANVDFDDTTLRTISGRVGGGCDRYVGRLTIEHMSENNCMMGDMKADSVYSLSLPPMKYFVGGPDIELATIPDGLDKADVVRFFKNLGMREVDLTTEDAELNFTYRAPLVVSIKGLDSYRVACPLTFEGRTLPANLPVIDQGERFDLAIEVGEYYGDDDQGQPIICPLDSGKVVIYDEIYDLEDEPQELDIVDGMAEYKGFASTPSLIERRVDADGNDRSFQKAFRTVVMVEGKDPVTETEWALVTGHVKPEGADFITYTSEPIPMYILRDPPGDKSKAWLEDGYSGRTTLSHIKNVLQVKGGIYTKIYFGVEKTFWAGVGAGTESKWSERGVFEFEAWGGFMIVDEEKTYINFSFKDKYSTSGSSDFIGEEGDVFVGAGMNFIFSEVRKIDVDRSACEITRSTEVGYQPDGFATTFAYTERYQPLCGVPHGAQQRRDR